MNSLIPILQYIFVHMTKNQYPQPYTHILCLIVLRGVGMSANYYVPIYPPSTYIAISIKRTVVVDQCS